MLTKCHRAMAVSCLFEKSIQQITNFVLLSSKRDL